MNHTEQLLTILRREAANELLPFLKSIDQKDEKAFSTDLKEISKDFLDYKEVRQGNSITFKRKGTEKQAELLSYAALAFLNQKDFEKAFNLWLTPTDKIDEILAWRCPKWFNRYINKFGNEDFVPNFINYNWIMSLSQNGHIVPSKEIIVKTLPAHLFQQTKDHKYHVRPENLLKFEITLSEHIWWFFDTENTIYASDRYLSFSDNTQNNESPWMIVLRDFAHNGRIEKHRILRESILATNRNYNKPLTGWFADLFMTLEPSTDELIELQTEILNALNSSHSKPVNIALNAIKKILDHQRFAFAAFLETTPLLLTSETKSIVNSTLTIIEKALKKHRDQTIPGCLSATQAFIHQDEGIQTKTAKLIAKFGSPGSDELRSAIAAYVGSLLTNPRAILAEFITETQNAISPEITEPLQDTIAEIAPVTSVDELIFLASQAFDNNQTWHIDQLPEAIIRMQEQIRGENIGKFEPALQRAIKVVFDGWTSTTGYLDQILALFFIDYANILIKNHPGDSISLQRILAHYQEKEWQNKKQWKGYTLRIIPLAEWKKPDGGTTYDIHKRLLQLALTRLRATDTLPLLSTPTHSPALIRPDSLISRLAAYEKAGRKPDSIDFQVAISRCDLSMASENEPGNSLVGEYQQLLEYLLQNKIPTPPFEFTNTWLVAAVAKRDNKTIEQLIPSTDINSGQLTGQFYWRAFVEPYMTTRYNTKKRAYEKVPDERKALKIEIRKGSSVGEGLIQKFFARFFKSKSIPTQDFVIYKSLTLNPRYISLEHNDAARLIYLIPNSPETLLASVISRCMTYPTLGEANEPRLIANTLEALVQLNVNYGETGHLFIAVAMLSPDKTIQSFAAELWLKHAGRNIDSERLGRIIGVIETIEFAPLKRLTDLLSGHMFNVTTYHNKQLEIMIGALLASLNSEALTNLKKLLEIYYELIASNRTPIPAQLVSRLQQWNSSPSLKRPIEKLKAFRPHNVDFPS